MIRKLDSITDLIEKKEIRVGMTRTELRGLLGPPDAEGGTSRRFKWPSIYKYGDVEFVFPSAQNSTEAEQHGLLYVYVDDGIDGVEEPLFLLSVT